MAAEHALRVESVGADGYVAIDGIVYPIKPGRLDRRPEIDTVDLAILRAALLHFSRTGMGGEAIRSRAAAMVQVVQAEMDALRGNERDDGLMPMDSPSLLTAGPEEGGAR